MILDGGVMKLSFSSAVATAVVEVAAAAEKTAVGLVIEVVELEIKEKKGSWEWWG